MSRLIIETKHQGEKDWTKEGSLSPGDRPASTEYHLPNGARVIYLARCERDDTSTVLKLQEDLDTEHHPIRGIYPIGYEIDAKLNATTNTHEIKIPLDGTDEEVQVRFTHKER